MRTFTQIFLGALLAGFFLLPAAPAVGQARCGPQGGSAPGGPQDGQSAADQYCEAIAGPGGRRNVSRGRPADIAPGRGEAVSADDVAPRAVHAPGSTGFLQAVATAVTDGLRGGSLLVWLLAGSALAVTCGALLRRREGRLPALYGRQGRRGARD